MAFWEDELMCSSRQLGLEMLRLLVELENQDFRKYFADSLLNNGGNTSEFRVSEQGFY